MGISFHQKGDFKKTEKFLKKAFTSDYMNILRQYGELGVQSLSANTPVDTGKTAASWYYTIEQNGSSLSVIWSNSNVVKGYCNIALILQYGHGTRNGGYVSGRDYINPALRPIFDAMAESAWKEVTSI